MTNEVQDSLNEGFENMAKSREYYSVLLSFDDIHGIITYRDLMRMLTRANGDGGGSLPMYIVGLPEDPFEAEATREKFTRVVQLIRKGYPEVTEARAVIKSDQKKGATKKRYEVRIFVSSPRRHLNYRGFGFELPEVFDDVSEWAKRLVSRYDKRRSRIRADPGVLTS